MDDSQLELFAAEEVDGFHDVLFEKQVDKTLRSVSTWMNRSSLTKAQASHATEAIREALSNNTEPEDITYCFTHASLLKSKKVVNSTVLKQALTQVEMDRSAGRKARKLFEKWHQNWYKNYVQNEGVIVKVIKDAFIRGVSYEALEEAMTIIGSQKQVVSDASLQYALVIADKRKVLSKNAGMNDLTDENEIGTMVSNTEFYSTEEAPW